MLSVARRVPRSPAVVAHRLLEALEPRTLFGGSPFPDVALLEDPSNPVVRLTTERGDVFIELLANQAPHTVAAYLAYLDNRASVVEHIFSDVQPGVSLTADSWYWYPGQGPFLLSNEFSVSLAEPFEGGRANTERTVATAVTPFPGATDAQMLVFNLGDNSATRSTDEYIVFARVIDNASWAVVQDIATLPTIDLEAALSLPPESGFMLSAVPRDQQYIPGDPVTPDLVVHNRDTDVVKAAGAPDYYRHAIYSAEGFTGSTISEFIPIENPGDQPAYVEVRTRYEAGSDTSAVPGSPDFPGTRDGTVFRAVIAPRSRSGYTVSTLDNWGDAQVFAGKPYALEIVSTVPVAASFSHYDFGIGTGQEFASPGALATAWTFPDILADALGTHDFLVWLNPSDQQGTVTLTFVNDAGFALPPIIMPLDRYRRGGVSVASLSLPSGHYAASLASTIPVLASLSHYRVTGLGPPIDGFGAPGQPGLPSIVGIVPIAVEPGDGPTFHVSQGHFSFFNTGASPAVISIDFYEPGSGTPVHSLTDAVTVEPGRRAQLDLTQLPGVTSATAVYRATQPVYAAYWMLRNDDSYSAQVAVTAGREFHFAEGFTDPERTAPNGLEETLTVFNPLGPALGLAPQAALVTFTFRYTDGTSFTIDQAVAGGTGFRLPVSSLQQVIDRANEGLNYYSIDVTSTVPVIAQMLHCDVTLGRTAFARFGGFTFLGSPFGPQTRLDGLTGG